MIVSVAVGQRMRFIFIDLTRLVDRKSLCFIDLPARKVRGFIGFLPPFFNAAAAGSCCGVVPGIIGFKIIMYLLDPNPSLSTVT